MRVTSSLMAALVLAGLTSVASSERMPVRRRIVDPGAVPEPVEIRDDSRRVSAEEKRARRRALRLKQMPVRR